MNCKAQLTLEYLMLLAGVLSAFMLLIPQATKFYNAIIFAIDSKNAEIFAEKIASEGERLIAFEEASIKSIKVKPNLEWNLKIEGKKITIEIQSSSLEKNKLISKQANAEFESFEKKISNEFQAGMKKKNNKILIINNEP